MRRVEVISRGTWRGFFERLCVIGFAMNFAYASVQASNDGHDDAAWFLGLISFGMAVAIAWPQTLTVTMNGGEGERDLEMPECLEELSGSGNSSGELSTEISYSL